eukprot:1577773-Prymnesium_polylepis.1
MRYRSAAEKRSAAEAGAVPDPQDAAAPTPLAEGGSLMTDALVTVRGWWEAKRKWSLMADMEGKGQIKNRHDPLNIHQLPGLQPCGIYGQRSVFYRHLQNLRPCSAKQFRAGGPGCALQQPPRGLLHRREETAGLKAA